MEPLREWFCKGADMIGDAFLGRGSWGGAHKKSMNSEVGFILEIGCLRPISSLTTNSVPLP